MGILNLGWSDLSWKLGESLDCQKTMEQCSDGWPESLTALDIATLQRPRVERPDGVSKLRHLMLAQFSMANTISRLVKIDHTVTIGQDTYTYHKVTDFAAWLAAQGETPSAHVAAWFDAYGVAGAAQAAPAPKVTTTVNTTKEKSRTADALTSIFDDAAKESEGDLGKMRTLLMGWIKNQERGFLGQMKDGSIKNELLPKTITKKQFNGRMSDAIKRL